MFKLAYQPGTLTAVNYDANGRAVSRSELKTADNPVLMICPEKKEAKPGEILYIPINIQDKHGIVEMNADRQVNVTVEGGELLAFGSAAPRTEEDYDTGSFTTYYGKAMAVVQAASSKQIVINATDGQEKAQATIIIK